MRTVRHLPPPDSPPSWAPPPPELDPRWRNRARRHDLADLRALAADRQIYDDGALYAGGVSAVLAPAFTYLIRAVEHFTGSETRVENAVESLRHRLHRAVDHHAETALARWRQGPPPPPRRGGVA